MPKLYSEKTRIDEIVKQKTELIKESKLSATLLDLVGIVDPTGVLDLLRSIYYYEKGEYMTATLLFISALPLGDIGAKPLLFASRYTRSGEKLKKAIDLFKSNPKQASKFLKELIDDPTDELGKFLKKSDDWGPLVLGKLSKSPKKSEMTQTIEDIIKFISGESKIAKGALGIDSKTAKNYLIPNIFPSNKIKQVLINDDPLFKVFSKILNGTAK